MRTLAPGSFSTVGPGLLHSRHLAMTTIHVVGGLIVVIERSCHGYDCENGCASETNRP